jgi:signal transduction histidine kinase
MLGATAVLAVLIAAVFFLMVRAIHDENDAADAARRAESAIAIAADLERTVIAGLDAGARDYLVTGQRRFLRPYRHAARAYPQLIDRLEVFAHGGIQRDAELIQVHEIEDQLKSYVDDYLRPTIALAGRDLAAARHRARPAEGRRRKVALRNLLNTLVTGERQEAAVANSRADRSADRALALGIAGGAGSVLLIAGFGLYLRRAVLRPAWRVAAAAERISAGDLSARAAGARPDGNELQRMKHAFNEMAASVEGNRDAMLEAERDKSQFLAVVSHELRTPITAMIESLAGLIEGESGRLISGEDLRALHKMKRDSEHLLRLVDDILFVAQTGAAPPTHFDEEAASPGSARGAGG